MVGGRQYTYICAYQLGPAGTVVPVEKMVGAPALS